MKGKTKRILVVKINDAIVQMAYCDKMTLTMALVHL